MKQIPYWGPTV